MHGIALPPWRGRNGLLALLLGLALATPAMAHGAGAGVSVGAGAGAGVSVGAGVDLNVGVNAGAAARAAAGAVAGAGVHVGAGAVAGAAVHAGAGVYAGAGVVAETGVHAVHTVSRVRELICSGGVSYQVRSGAWVHHEHGSVPIDLPLAVHAGDVPCRVFLPGVGSFEAEAASRFIVDRGVDGVYLLTIETGDVHYAVGEDVMLRVAAPRCSGLGAYVGRTRTVTERTVTTEDAAATVDSEAIVHSETTERTVVAERPVVAAPLCYGRAVVDASDSFQIYNMGGGSHVAIEREGRLVREVAEGRHLRVRFAASLSASAEAGVTAVRSGDRLLMIRDSVTDLDDEYVARHAAYKSVRRGSKAVLKSSRVSRSEYEDESYDEFDSEDTHSHQKGRGHIEHGNGKGLGHYKECGNSGKALGLEKVHENNGKALGRDKEHGNNGKALGRDKEHGNNGKALGHFKESDDGEGRGKGNGHGKGNDKGGGKDKGNGNGKGNGKGHGKGRG